MAIDKPGLANVPMISTFRSSLVVLLGMLRGEGKSTTEASSGKEFLRFPLVITHLAVVIAMLMSWA